MVETCTRSKESVLNGRLNKAGVHVSALETFSPEMKGLDENTLLNQHLIVDTCGGTLAESGQTHMSKIRGTMTERKFHAEPSEVVAGLIPAR